MKRKPHHPNCKETSASNLHGAARTATTGIKGSRRSARIQALTKRLIAVAERRTIKVALFSQKKIRRVFLGDDSRTKHALAEIIAERFPEELGFRLPPKRRAWMSEDSRMDIFDAVALALMIH